MHESCHVLFLEIRQFPLTLWGPAVSGIFEKKTLKRTCLCAGISLVVSSKDRQVLQLTLEKICLFGVCVGFFVSDIISGGLLGNLGPLHLVLGSKR